MEKNSEILQTTWKNFPTDTEGVVGFVYLIRNLVDSKYYLGKKLLLKKIRRKKKTKKGTTINKISYVDNDVEKYWGSSKELLSDIATHGLDNFSREVIEVCNSKFHMSWGEMQWQLKCNALLDDKFYNGIINIRLSRKSIPKGFVDIERDPATLGL